MIADVIESCETCKLLDKTQYETRHGFCLYKQEKRRYSKWPCCKYEEREKDAQGESNDV